MSTLSKEEIAVTIRANYKNLQDAAPVIYLCSIEENLATTVPSCEIHTPHKATIDLVVSMFAPVETYNLLEINTEEIPLALQKQKPTPKFNPKNDPYSARGKLHIQRTDKRRR